MIAAAAEACGRWPFVTLVVVVRAGRGGPGLRRPHDHLRQRASAPAAAERALRRPAQGVPAGLRRAERHRHRRGVAERRTCPRNMRGASPGNCVRRDSRRPESPTGSTPPTSTTAHCSISRWTISSSCATGCSTTRNSSRATRRSRHCPGSSRGSISRSPTRWPSASSISGWEASDRRISVSSSP